MKKIIPSCSMCQHFDPLRDKCNVYNEATKADETERASQCNEEATFIRDMNVIPDYYNLYSNGEEAPAGWEPDFSKVQKDNEGKPLYVITNRGYERALPAYDGVILEVSSDFGHVPLWTTYQGQREMVYELGYELAKKAVEEKGYKLHTLPGEEEYKGLEKYKRHFLHNKPRKKNVLLSDEPIEVWD